MKHTNDDASKRTNKKLCIEQKTYVTKLNI